MVETSLPRFILTQGGNNLNVAAIAVLRASPSMSGFGVFADLGRAWEVELGMYNTFDDARYARDLIVTRIADPDAFLCMPARDFRTQEADE